MLSDISTTKQPSFIPVSGVGYMNQIKLYKYM